jgi:hypothetical protein
MEWHWKQKWQLLRQRWHDCNNIRLFLKLVEKLVIDSCTWQAFKHCMQCSSLSMLNIWPEIFFHKAFETLSKIDNPPPHFLRVIVLLLNFNALQFLIFCPKTTTKNVLENYISLKIHVIINLNFSIWSGIRNKTSMSIGSVYMGIISTVEPKLSRFRTVSGLRRSPVSKDRRRPSIVGDRRLVGYYTNLRSPDYIRN